MGKLRKERHGRSRPSHGALPQETTSQATKRSHQGRRWISYALIFLIALVLGAGGHWFLDKPHQTTAAVVGPETVHSRPSLAQLVEMPEAELAKVDIGWMNLMCAQGLPRPGKTDANGLLATLDKMTERVRSETLRNYHLFLTKPHEFENSEAYYRLAMMGTVLAQDLGVHYNPAKAASPSEENLRDTSFYDNADDVFISGLLESAHSGTCTSMPVLAAAVGRRLGYPLKLVAAKAHLFCRWDDGKERRNLEYMNGIVCHPDEYYLKWPFPVSDAEVNTGYYLKSLSPKEELAVFLQLRSSVLSHHQRNAEALLAISQADVLHSGHPDIGTALMMNARRRIQELGLFPSEPRQPIPSHFNDPMADIREVEAINAANRARIQTGFRPPSNRPAFPAFNR